MHNPLIDQGEALSYYRLIESLFLHVELLLSLNREIGSHLQENINES